MLNNIQMILICVAAVLKNQRVTIARPQRRSLMRLLTDRNDRLIDVLLTLSMCHVPGPSENCLLSRPPRNVRADRLVKIMAACSFMHTVASVSLSLSVLCRCESHIFLAEDNVYICAHKSPTHSSTCYATACRFPQVRRLARPVDRQSVVRGAERMFIMMQWGLFLLFVLCAARNAYWVVFVHTISQQPTCGLLRRARADRVFSGGRRRGA
jgi:hypothetical protein